LPEWFGFRSPQELLAKLERELTRLQQNPSDGDTTFNFFITAWSLVDWLHPGNPSAREALRANHPILQVVAHLADGAKHFQLGNPKHRSVLNTARGANWGAWPMPMNPGQRPVSPSALFVHLDGDAAKEFGSFPAAVKLAEATLAWLRDYITTMRQNAP